MENELMSELSRDIMRSMHDIYINGMEEPAWRRIARYILIKYDIKRKVNEEERTAERKND